MKSVEKNECIYYSVPPYITRFWADENGKVKFFSKDFDDELDECDYEALYQESVEIYAGPKDTDTFDPFLRPDMEKELTALAEGNVTGLNQNNTPVYLYVSSQFNVNFRAIGRIRFVLKDNKSLIKQYGRKGRLDYILEALLITLRHTDEVEMEMRMAVENLPIILDLKPVLVGAPEGTAFVLSDFPLLYFNLLNSNQRRPLLNDEDYYGVVFIVPLSPRYALCLYDSYTYKIKKEGDRVVFSDDDMLLLNASLMNNGSPTIAYTETEKFPASLLQGLRHKETSEELSVLGIRNRALEKTDELRPHVSEVRKFDAIEHYSENYGSLSERDNAIRLAYAYQILKES